MSKNIYYIKISHLNEKETKRLFEELSFYNVSIEKQNVKGFKNLDLLQELPFYDELIIYEMSKAFGCYIRSYAVNSKDPLAQSIDSESNIKNLFKDLLDKIKASKYQITVRILLRKDKGSRDIEFSPASFDSTTKVVIIFKYELNKSLQGVLYKIENWIYEGSRWVIEIVEAEFVNTLLSIMRKYIH